MTDHSDTELDSTIRSGLVEGAAEIDEIAPSALAVSLAQRRHRAPRSDAADRARRGRGTGPHRFGAVAAALVALVALVGGVVGGAAVWGSDDPHQVQVGDGDGSSAEGGPFAGWAPGWHEIEPGPVPPMSVATITWFDGRLVVSGLTDRDATTGLGPTHSYEFDPTTRSWTTLPDLTLLRGTIIAAGDALVAVGTVAADPALPTAQVPSWATWQRGDPAWTERGTVPVAAEYRALGTLGPGTIAGGFQLVWTGERVLDISHGAVIDLHGDGAATALSLPLDLPGYTGLLSASAVWTGTQAVLASWSPRPGLAWNADGTEVVALPALDIPFGAVSGEATAAALDGTVVLIADRPAADAPGAVRLGPSGAWSSVPNPPASATGCPNFAAAVGGSVLAERCDTTGVGRLWRLTDEAWQPVEPGPPTSPCCPPISLGTDGAYIRWETATDTYGTDLPPFARGQVWIPGPSDDRADPGPATAPDTTAPDTTAVTAPSCDARDVTDLADLRPSLPARFDTGPRPGLGGAAPGPVEECARWWGVSTEPGVHVTQLPGSSPYGIGSPRLVGRVLSGTIEDGLGITVSGELPFTILAYGLTDAEAQALVTAIETAWN